MGLWRDVGNGVFSVISIERNLDKKSVDNNHWIMVTCSWVNNSIAPFGAFSQERQ